MLFIFEKYDNFMTKFMRNIKKAHYKNYRNLILYNLKIFEDIFQEPNNNCLYV